MNLMAFWRTLFFLHSALCIFQPYKSFPCKEKYIIVSDFVFIGFCMCKVMCLRVCVYFWWFCFDSFFLLICFVSFCFFKFYHHHYLDYSEEEKERVWVWWAGWSGGSSRKWKRGTKIRIYCMKRTILSKKKKTINKTSFAILKIKDLFSMF